MNNNHIKLYKYINDYINELYRQKNDISNNEFFNDEYEEKIENIKETLNKCCNHNWVSDEYDFPDGEGTYKLTYCQYCQLKKK
jgi:hypothetical protein